MTFSRALLNFIFVYFLVNTTCFNPITTALMFDIAQIGPENHNKDIVIAGAGTYISTDGIQLASHAPTMESSKEAQSQDIVGHATYAKLLHLWDTVSGQLADFTTIFTFAISSDDGTSYGDGLSFFLGRNSPLYTAGGTMGLPVIVNSSVNTHMTASSPFVAVELDTYWNKDWDPVDSTDQPMGDHVGININSLFSVKAEKWSNITFNKEGVVKIHYDSASQNLSVTFTYFHNTTVTTNQFELHYTVDLRRELPEWVSFGFSASSSKDHCQKNSIKSWYFLSSDLPVDQIRWRKDKKKRRIIQISFVSLLSVLIIGVFGVCVGVFFFWNKKSNNQNIDEVISKDPAVTFQSNNHPRAFSFEELSQATNNFEEGNKLGEGGFGAVYKGALPDGLHVAVKRVSATSEQGIKEYKAEVEIIGQARHRHLVQLIGWCHEREEELLVVYELLENRSLDGHLFKSRIPLPWNVRYNIAKGLAKALRYLHQECVQCILHRDIKSSNVMLDSEFNPKLGDFGLAKLVDHDKSSKITALAGTVGYLAPECFSNGKVSKQSDVYSYGVVVLEIAAGRKCIDQTVQEDQISLIKWIQELYGIDEDRILEAVDSKLGDDYDKNQMKAVITLGLRCVHTDPNERPSISEVLRALNDLSDLPREMPRLVHNAPINPPQRIENADMSAAVVAYNTEPNQDLLVILSSGNTATAPAASRNWWKSLIFDLWHLLEIE